MISSKGRAILLVAVWVGFAGGAAAQPVPGGKGKGQPPRMALVERFDQLTPAERWQLVVKAGKGDKELQAAARGDLTLTVVERGSVESAKNNDIHCTVRSFTKGSTVATTIKWVADEGTAVKKGDLVCQLDDAPYQELLKARKRDVEASRTELERAAANLEMTRKDNQARARLKEIEARLAELDLKKYAGKDADEKEALQLKVERARLELERARTAAKAREAKASADVKAREAVVAQEQARLREIEDQIKACRILAPVDGRLMYHVPEQVRGGGGQHAIVAQGEPVRAGQKLFQIPDLTDLLVGVRVPEAQVGHLRGAKAGDKEKWQRAVIRVDAFPRRILNGHVYLVDTVAQQKDFFTDNVKLYKVLVKIDEQLPGLKPGMTAEVRVLARQKKDVVHVPADAVARAGKASYCYVKAGQEIHKREVVPGLRTDVAWEIEKGLKEGETVISDPHGLFRRLSPLLTPTPKDGQ
jgi:RND family efflux transporter MFP subunit